MLGMPNVRTIPYVFHLSDKGTNFVNKSNTKGRNGKYLDQDAIRIKNDVVVFTNENKILLKQRNIFCQIAKLLYTQLTQFYHNNAIS